jgi:hypothetical protein
MFNIKCECTFRVWRKQVCVKWWGYVKWWPKFFDHYLDTPLVPRWWPKFFDCQKKRARHMTEVFRLPKKEGTSYDFGKPLMKVFQKKCQGVSKNIWHALVSWWPKEFSCNRIVPIYHFFSIAIQHTHTIGWQPKFFIA